MAGAGRKSERRAITDIQIIGSRHRKALGVLAPDLQHRDRDQSVAGGVDGGDADAAQKTDLDTGQFAGHVGNDPL